MGERSRTGARSPPRCAAVEARWPCDGGVPLRARRAAPRPDIAGTIPARDAYGNWPLANSPWASPTWRRRPGTSTSSRRTTPSSDCGPRRERRGHAPQGTPEQRRARGALRARRCTGDHPAGVARRTTGRCPARRAPDRARGPASPRPARHRATRDPPRRRRGDLPGDRPRHHRRPPALGRSRRPRSSRPPPTSTHSSPPSPKDTTFHLGVHLTITSETDAMRWAPVAPRGRVGSLLDDAGLLRLGGTDEARPAEIERELDAQLARVRATGVRLSHLDSHQGALLYHGAERFAALRGVAKRACLPIPIPETFFRKFPYLAEALDDGQLPLADLMSIDPSCWRGLGGVLHRPLRGDAARGDTAPRVLRRGHARGAAHLKPAPRSPRVRRRLRARAMRRWSGAARCGRWPAGTASR